MPTRQHLNRAHDAIIAAAEQLEEPILASRLAHQYGVSPLTARRWLVAAGFVVNERPGRPRGDPARRHIPHPETCEIPEP